MRHFLMTLLGASFITMSTAATSDTGSILLLETTKGQVEIKLLADLAPKHVTKQARGLGSALHAWPRGRF